MRPLRLQEKELSYLTDDQVAHLFRAIHERCRTPHVAMVAAICLATGSQALTPDRVRGRLVAVINTKGKRVRSIPIDAILEARIQAHFKQHGLFTIASTASTRP